MNTLIIHPNDHSTDFLKPIYANIQNKTVITGGIPKPDLDQLIKRYQRIIMLGHGCPFGLFSVGQFPNTGVYIIDDISAMYLRSKINFCFWCYGDEYAYRHSLRGIFTGMFISEMDEAHQFLTDFVNPSMIDESNDRFANIIGKNINEPINIIYRRLVEGFGELVSTNPVARFNFQRLYYSG